MTIYFTIYKVIYCTLPNCFSYLIKKNSFFDN